jgi:hypothetical protein
MRNRCSLFTDISEERTIFIFRIEDMLSKQVSIQQTEHTVLAADCLACFRTLMMVAVYSSETVVNFCQTTQYHIPEDNTVHSYCHMALKSDNFVIYLQVNNIIITVSKEVESKFKSLRGGVHSREHTCCVLSSNVSIFCD